MGVSILEPITHDDFIDRRYYGKNISTFYIDDVDLLLQLLTNVPIEVVTFNGGQMQPFGKPKTEKPLPGQTTIDDALEAQK
jgi:hypothetical protein